MPTRRDFLRAASCSAALSAVPSISAALTLPVSAPSFAFRGLPASLLALERSAGGRLGVAVLDTGNDALTGHRTAERFAMCSTCKVLLAAAVLRRVDHGEDRLDRLLPIPQKPLVSHSPATEPHAGGTMPVRDLCHAILTQSDNTATNLLLEALGGPAAITHFAQCLGDQVTRLDRTETTLNTAIPGDPRDTTSPAATAADLQKILLGNVLQPASRAQLEAWMVENQSGMERLRAHLPPGWRAADKTGSNGETTGNDIAVYWPPHRAPVIVTAYLTECPGTDAYRGTVLASVGRIVVAALQA